jgi:hypothetical protein
MKRLLFAIAIFALAISACDVLRGGLGMPTNDKPVVTVSSSGTITVDPDPLRFERRHGVVVITWELADNSPFRFKGPEPGRPAGIHIDREEGKPGRDDRHIDAEFSGGQVIANGRKFQLTNRVSRGGTYKYSIRLVGPGGEVKLDPAIINIE